MDKTRINVTEAEIIIKLQVENINHFYQRLQKGTIQFSIATKSNLLRVDVKELGKKVVTITGEEIKD